MTDADLHRLADLVAERLAPAIVEMCRQPTPDPFVEIYALCEPDSGEVRYVGRATDAEARYGVHLQPSRGLRASHKEQWIAGLLVRGERPALRILEVVRRSEQRAAELRWLLKFAGEGCRMTNTARL